jgi:glucose uptake protein GlcU
MSSVLVFTGYAVAGVFVLWAIAIAVYLIGARMKSLVEAYETDPESIVTWGLGVLYSVAGLVLLFLVVRFVKFAWEL